VAAIWAIRARHGSSVSVAATDVPGVGPVKAWAETFHIGAHSMPRKVISTGEAPEYSSYSQAVKVGNTIYVAGTTGVDVTTGEFAGPTVQEQARQSLLNCQAILRAGGAELSDAVMVHTLLLRPEDADGLIEVFDEFFPDVRPPRCVSKIGVDRPGLLVSIAMVAVTD
jgi:2-iminobutanoate/2-iminopropanoate deaminase